MTRRLDVVIAGTGPAGLLLGAALARRGLEVGCISPDADASWPANYGIWADDAVRAGIDRFVPQRFASPRVDLLGAPSVTLERSYGMIDGPGLRAHLVSTQGLQLRRGRVTGVEVGRTTRVETDSGTLDARVLVDASGGAILSARRGGAPRGYQSAWGAVFEVEGLDASVLRLMDWSWEDPAGGPPGFLYAVPRGPGRVFLEETVLVWPEPVTMDRLADRLARRLAAMGVAARRIDDHEERCVIVMGGGRPPAGQGWVSWGAAAGMVHPATGYLLGHTAVLVESVAASIDAALATGAEPRFVSSAARAEIWSPSRERVWDLFEYGSTALQRMNQVQLSQFFSTFFRTSSQDWAAFLSGTAAPGDVVRLMWRVFAGLDGSLRKRLVKPVFDGHAGLLLSGVLPR